MESIVNRESYIGSIYWYYIVVSIDKCDWICIEVQLQCILAYLNLGYLNTSIIQTPKMSVLLECFIIYVRSIRVNVCSIIVALYKTQWASVISEQIHLIYLNTFGSLQELRCSDSCIDIVFVYLLLYSTSAEGL